MPVIDYPRRPRTRSLAAIYDRGAEDARRGRPCPYEPPQERGDDIRAYLWSQGYEDELTVQTVRRLV